MTKCDDVVAALGLSNISIFVAPAGGIYRKPLSGVFEQFMSRANRDASFFVGDSAGRENDFNCSDRAFAYNARIGFKTPEVRGRLIIC